MKKPIPTICSLSIVFAGCATSSKDIATTYVSPLAYQSYDCEQLAAEAQRNQVRVGQLGGRLDEASTSDKVITTVGVILFWPILFALGGTKQQEADYARLKGEYDATQQAAISKKCPAVVPSAQPQTASTDKSPQELSKAPWPSASRLNTLEEYATPGPWFRLYAIAMFYFPTLSDDANELVQAGQKLMTAALSMRDYDHPASGGGPCSTEGRVPLQAAYDDAANNVHVLVSTVAETFVPIMNTILAKPESISAQTAKTDERWST